RFTLSILFLSLVAFAAGFLRHWGEADRPDLKEHRPAKEGSPPELQTPAPPPQKTASVAGPVDEKSLLAAFAPQRYMGAVEENLETYEVNLCRVLMGCGANEFRTFGEGR